MDTNEILTKIIQKVIRYKTAIVGCFILFSGLYLFSNYSLIYLDIDNQTNYKDIEIQSISKNKTSTLWSLHAILTPRDVSAIRVSSGNNVSTQVALQIPWYGFVYKTIPLNQDKNAEKIAFNSSLGTNCSTYSPERKQLLYYGCSKPAALLSYSTPQTGQWSSEVISQLDFMSKSTTPYMGGVMGFNFKYGTDIVYPAPISFVNEQGVTSYYDTPPDINYEDFITTQIVTDTSNTKNPYFALISKKGDVFLGVPTTGLKVDYKKIPAPTKYNQDYNKILCDIKKDSLFCHYGVAFLGDAAPTRTRDSSLPPQIAIYSFSKETTSISPIDGEDLYFSDFKADNDGNFYGLNFSFMYRFYNNNNNNNNSSSSSSSSSSYKLGLLSRNTVSIASDDQVYYSQDNKVYLYNPKTEASSQVFYSSNIKPVKLYSVNGNLFIIATIPGRGKTTYAYKLLTESKNTTPGQRLIDILPSSLNNTSSVDIADVIDNRIYVRLPVAYKKNSQTKDGSVDKLEVEEAKQQVLQGLRARNIDTNLVDISFVY